MAGKYSEKEKIFFVEERKNREEKGGKYLEKEKIFFVEERKNREEKGGKYLEFNLEVWSLTIPWFSAVTPSLMVFF